MMKSKTGPDDSVPERENLYAQRRFFHVAAASLLPVAILLFSQIVVLGLAAGATALLIVWETARLATPAFNRWFLKWLPGLFKPEEERRVTGATYLAIASLIAIAAFDAPVAALCLLYLALGDPAAALVGTRYGRLHFFSPRLWKPRQSSPKSLEGTLAFLVVALGVAVLLWGLGAYGLFWSAAAGALVAAVVEATPLPVDDNLSVPLVSGAVMLFLGVG